MTTREQVVYAMQRALIPLPDGRTVLVAKGSHWHEDDQIVKAHPAMFSTDPRWGLSYSAEPKGFSDPIGPSLADVEAATAAPGEKRAAARRG